VGRSAFIDSSDLGVSVKGFCNHNTIVSCLPTNCSVTADAEVGSVLGKHHR
jgi:hypothetical protein